MKIYDCGIIGSEVSSLSTALCLASENKEVIIFNESINSNKVNSDIVLRLTNMLYEEVEKDSNINLNKQNITRILRQTDNKLFKVEIGDSNFFVKSLVFSDCNNISGTSINFKTKFRAILVAR